MTPSTSSPTAEGAVELEVAQDSIPEDKRARILDAAQELFLRYGVRRTSMDDVARSAGIAKGTVYLSFRSKDALFASLAERMCAEILVSARKAASAPLPLAIRVVGYLDAYVGAMSRLLARSPHAAELIESKQALATPVFARFETRFQEALAALLRNGGIERSDAPLMFLAAAHGALKTGDLSEAAYRRRLTLLVEALIAGLERELGRPAKRPSALPPRIQNERRGAESRASERNR